MATRDTRPIRRTAAGDLSGALWRFGKETSTGVAACSIAGERADGIISGGFPKAPTIAGDPVDLDVERLMKVEAGCSRRCLGSAEKRRERSRSCVFGGLNV